MTPDTSQIGNRAWSFAHVLRDDGLSYLAYIEQITFLLFLKMADELTHAPYNRDPIIPPELGWQSLLDRDSSREHVHSRSLEGYARFFLAVIAAEAVFAAPRPGDADDRADDPSVALSSRPACRFVITASRISSSRSGLSRMNCLTFSRPWPSRTFL